MSERSEPKVYSIAAHRGFADALVAGIAARYGGDPLALARLTLLVPSARARLTFSEAFIRHYGDAGQGGVLMPRMAAIGDLELDEALGPLLDPLGNEEILPAVDPNFRWLKLAQLLETEAGVSGQKGATRLRLAREIAATMDRLLIEGIGPEQLVGDEVIALLGDLAAHWQESLRVFARIQARWLAELDGLGRTDAATRRNHLFELASRQWRSNPPISPVIAAGVTSASPALAKLLRTVSNLPQGAVVLPDFDLTMSEDVWQELGSAGGGDGRPIQSGDAVTHPQYHLKLLLNRMGVAREEVRAWHRKGPTAAPPQRSHAISNLFLPPEASKAWVDLPADKRRMSGIRICECANPEEEAQLIALLVREAVEVPEKRVALVTPDRALAQRVVQHLRRWNITADDSAGRPLSQTQAGRLFLLLAELWGEQAAPVPLIALLQHPLVQTGDGRAQWLQQVRALELALRGPRREPGLQALADIAEAAGLENWWKQVCAILSPLLELGERAGLSDLLDVMSITGEALCSEVLWGREDGRALSAFVEDLRLQARLTRIELDCADVHIVLREAMDLQAVRLPYGGHPRIAIYGLLESRMTRADLVICGGLVEGVWPARSAPDPLLAPPVLRALGVPGTDFRTGLAAHDLAGVLGAPEVVLTRADRDVDGPIIPSRFLLRLKALLGAELTETHRETAMLSVARAMDDAPPTARYVRPQPMPGPEQRRRDISVTQLDRLRSDPYQFYASKILGLNELDLLDADPSPAWQGELAHRILEDWHRGKGTLAELADIHLAEMHAHPVMRALWRPRLLKGLEWVEAEMAAFDGRTPFLFEEWGDMTVRDVRIFGKADRIDRLESGDLAIVDYKTGSPPSGAKVAAGYALQLGTIGLMAEAGAFGAVSGTPTSGTPTIFEYWSLGRSAKSPTGFGYITTPLLIGNKRSGIAPVDFLPEARRFLHEALDRWVLGAEPFTARLNPNAPGYATYDQLMRLDEWMGREE